MNELKKNYDKTLVVPLEYEMWFSLRKVAFDQQVSMNNLAREAIKKVIKKYEKNVDA
jgi:predicted HicB family RNase H-like nuclease